MRNKIIKISDIDNILSKHRANNSILVQSHGVFDLLHIGHIKYFNEAKAMGNILIVTITPDHFVNKGPGRPVFTEQLRAEALSALSVVDYVVINEYPSAEEIIKLIKPNIYVKGPDYKDFSKDVTGKINDEKLSVESIGGEIAFTSGEIFSSSNLINNYLISRTDEQESFILDLKKSYSIDTITKFIDNLSNLKVLVVGEIIIDEYILCNSVGKSGKEPVLVNQKIASEKYAGGSIAVGNHLSDFCKEITIMGYIGDRNSQEDFIKNRLAKNVKLEPIIKSDSPTILKTRHIDNYTKTKVSAIYDINDTNLNEQEEIIFCNKLNESIESYDVVIVVDYGHGLISPEITKIIEDKSKFLSINTQLNSFNRGYHTISKYKRADYICVHAGELRYDSRNRFKPTEVLMKELSEKMRTTSINITLGKDGAVSLKNNQLTKCPAFADKILDRVGAGDTVLAITSVCNAVNIPNEIILLIGNLAAADKVSHTGTGFILNKISLIKSIQTLFK